MFLIRSIWVVSSKRLDSINDYTRHGYQLRVDCLRCKRVAIIDPKLITALCSSRGWSREIRAVEARLVCAECGSRRVRCGPVFGD